MDPSMISNILLNSGGKAAGGGSGLDKILDILGSKGGQTVVNAAAAGLGAYGQAKQAGEDRAQNAAQFGANMAQRQMEADQADQRSRAAATLDASPLGGDQRFAQQQALFGQLLGNARNFSVAPGDPRVAAAMGAGPQGGMRLPEGGFDPAMIERLFGDQATLASLAQHGQQIGQMNPHAPVMDMAPMFGQAGATATSGIKDANAIEMARQQAESDKQREIIRRALEQDIAGEKAKKEGGGNIFGKILKGVGMGASFIPGVGQIAAPVLTGLGGLVNGDGLKSSLINAGVSAIPFGAGKIAKAAGSASTLGKVAGAVSKGRF